MESFISKNRLVLDRLLTTINVWGDSIGAAVIEKLEPDENTA
ncbi:MAG: hypothetical protein OXC39_02595 [Candidatus Dadabacteria bacterium]|nr:hypothetical protein [Candidatus Dadabacteria bacterium]